MYSYDTALGFKFLDVPLIIGLNWVIIVAASSSIIKYFIKKPLILQALLAAALCTLLDFQPENIIRVMIIATVPMRRNRSFVCFYLVGGTGG